MKIFVFLRKPTLVFVCLLLAESATYAQKGDWQTVKTLKPGTAVSVKTRHRYLCTVDQVTPDSWLCRPHRARMVPIPMPPSFARAEIREIRLEHNRSKDA